MAEPSPTAPAPTCYLLDRLPVELRLIIYKHAFAGSRLQATIKKNDNPSSARGPPRARAVLRWSKHVALLLTCRTIHNEAFETFWSETTLRLKCPPFIFRTGRSSEFDASKLLVNSFCYRLCASLPKSVKANIRHVRAMILPALDSNWVRMHPSMTASALLGMFKKLVTCEITPTLAHPVDHQVTHYEVLEDKQYGRFMMLEKAPAKFLVDRYGLDNNMIDRVALIFKGSTNNSQSMKYGPGKIEVFESCRSPRNWPVYRNFSNGIAFVDVTSKMDVEECYKKLLQAKV